MISNAEKLRKWRAANPDKFRTHLKNYRIKHAEEIKAYKKKYNAEMADVIREQKKAWAVENRDKVREQQRAWRKANRVSILERNARRRAIKMQRTVGPVDIEVLLSDMTCGICGCSIEGPYHIDHIIPLARGGFHTQDNLQLAHPKCNLMKKDKLPDDFVITTN